MLHFVFFFSSEEVDWDFFFAIWQENHTKLIKTGTGKHVHAGVKNKDHVFCQRGYLARVAATPCTIFGIPTEKNIGIIVKCMNSWPLVNV